MLTINVGDRITHSQEGEGTVLRIVNLKLLDVVFDDDAGTRRFIEIASKNIEAVNGTRLVPTVNRSAKYKPVRPSELSSLFLETLTATKEQVKIRVLYPKHAEERVQDIFSSAGVSLPEDIRAIDSGARGGQTIQRDWAAVVWFPETPAAPEGSKQDSSHPGFMMNSRRDVVLGVLKAGFPITDYAHAEG